MNVRLKKIWQWTSGLVYDGEFAVNQYTVTVNMDTVTTDRAEQNIAYDRMKLFVTEILQHAVILSSRTPDLADWKKTNARIVELPEDPVDQVLGIMLYVKLNAMMENRMVVTGIEIASELGDNMSYLHDHGESLGPLAAAGWWHDARPIWYNDRPKRSKDKVVCMDRNPDWKNYGLSWPTDQESAADTRVLFAAFPRNEDQ